MALITELPVKQNNPNVYVSLTNGAIYTAVGDTPDPVVVMAWKEITPYATRGN